MEIGRIKGEKTEIALALRSAFSGDDGRQAFVWILRKCCHFTQIENEEQRARYNLGIELLEAMGIYHLPHEAEIATGLLDTVLVSEK